MGSLFLSWMQRIDELTKLIKPVKSYFNYEPVVQPG